MIGEIGLRPECCFPGREGICFWQNERMGHAGEAGSGNRCAGCAC